MYDAVFQEWVRSTVFLFAFLSAGLWPLVAVIALIAAATDNPVRTKPHHFAFLFFAFLYGVVVGCAARALWIAWWGG